MNILLRIIRKMTQFGMYYPRKLYYSQYKKKLINQSPTIIASDCFGGIVYHNLGLKFMSPTINLYIPKYDFFMFVKDLKGFLTAELVEEIDSSVDYPVGTLEYNGEKIRLYFVHYKDFKTAKEKWDIRKQRVDYSNIYIIQTSSTATENDIKLFDELPYRNKLLITTTNPTNSANVYVHPILLKKNYQSGEILRYKHWFSLKRHMDDIDYVGFLNKSN